MSHGFAEYTSYSATGIEWVDSLPSHWRLDKFRYVCALGRGLPITKANLEDCGIPCVNYGEVHSKFGFEVNVEKHQLRCVDASYLESMPNALLDDGDFVFADTSEDIEGAGNFTQVVGNNPIFAGYHTIIARLKRPSCSRFLAYIFDSPEFRNQVRLSVKGIKVFSITQEILKGTDLWLPPLPEQEVIASFLDHETVKIDTLIAKQERLLELLKEKRQAVISHAITKGLDPEAPLKDSGVKWLGKAPVHWTIKRLKHISPKVGVGLVINPSTYVTDTGVPFLFGGDIVEYGFKLEKARKMSDSDSRKLPQSRLNKGDLVCVRVGYPGVTAVISEELDGANCASVAVIRKGKFNSNWLCYALNSTSGRKQVESVQYGAAQKQFNISDAVEFWFAVPPLKEQADIAAYLDSIRTKFHRLERASLQQIDLLRERRSALISAAVTGKIDVRDWKSESK